MVDQGDPVSVAILSLLSFITIILTGYLSLYCYTHYKSKTSKLSKKTLSTSSSTWLDTERRPLIPGNFHTQTIQPVPAAAGDHDYEESLDDDLDMRSCKERDYSELGRIIFVMRYSKKREELMVRLVQIEGMPASQELYCPNSAYVDVGLKYTGNPETKQPKNQKPPRLDICLQQVYYFIISTEQMLSHSLEFRINTFDEHFRRYVCGVVEVKLSEEMGEDIFSGNEVVFVEEILEPFQILSRNQFDGAGGGEDAESFESTISELDDEDEDTAKCETTAERTRPSSSCSSSNMSWEPEVSKELLSTSTNSIWNRCLSMQDLHSGDLSDDKRSHSIGYLPTYEWTVKDIPLEEELLNEQLNQSINTDLYSSSEYHNNYERVEPSTPEMRRLPLHLPLISDHINPSATPESFYHIVPVTPLYNAEMSKSDNIEHAGVLGGGGQHHRRVAYRKYPKRKLLARSLTMKRPANLSKSNKRTEDKILERSSSCPSLSHSEKSHKGDEESPERKLGDYFF